MMRILMLFVVLCWATVAQAQQIVQFDRGTGANGTANNTASVTHIVGDYGQRVIYLAFTSQFDAALASTPTCGATTLTQISTRLSGGAATRKVWVYEAVAPAVGSQTCSVVFTASNTYAMCVISLYNVDQATPSDTPVTNQGTGLSITSGAIASAVGDMVLTFSGWRGVGSTVNTPDATWTIPATCNTANTAQGIAGGYEDGAASVSRTDAIAPTNDWGSIGVNVNQAANTISITSPLIYETYQRDSGNTYDIPFTGAYTGTAPTNVEVDCGAGYATITSSPSGGTWSGTRSDVAAGQWTCRARYTNNTAVSTSVTYVGVGDRVAVAGQSNASCRGTVSQVYYDGLGLVATMHGNDYVHRALVDAFDSDNNQVDAVSDDAALPGGCWVLPLATHWMAYTKLPVEFVPCAKGGTPVLSWAPGADHVDRATLYGSCNYRSSLFGGIKTYLWWQGEDDAQASLSQATYNSRFDTVANAVGTDRGVKVIAASLQNSSGIPDVDEVRIRDAIAEAVNDNTNVKAGPDFRDMGSDDTYHFTTTAKLQVAAARWWLAIYEAIFDTASGTSTSDCRVRIGPLGTCWP